MNTLLNWQHGPAVKKLLAWKQGEEEEKWAERAVDSLVKKLKKKKRGEGEGTLDDLEWALSHPSQHSPCVTIPKSLDGRLQVSHKKGLPHVIYCKVWRWPDLQSHQELRAISECNFPYDSRSAHICINPYHYQRIDSGRMFQTPSPSYHSGSTSPLECASMAGYSPPTSASPIMYSASPSMHLGHSPMALSDDESIPSPHQHMSASPLNKLFAETKHFWANIMYYELNTRVGEQFKVSEKCVVVDGFTDPSNSEARICLGLLSNVNRNTTIETTRRHIGKGIRLVYTENRDVEITNLSNASVFVQSRNCNIKLGMASHTVFRIPSGTSYRIFDFSIFSALLQNARSAGYNNVYDLQKMCIIRISFVKGWGPEYQRQDVTSTPCWIEIQLHNPLAWIDACLKTAGSPQTDATSVS